MLTKKRKDLLTKIVRARIEDLQDILDRWSSLGAGDSARSECEREIIELQQALKSVDSLLTEPEMVYELRLEMDEFSYNLFHQKAAALGLSDEAAATVILTEAVTEPQRENLEEKENKKISPDWSKAPSWANYWAVNANGCALWFEREPKILSDHWATVSFIEQIHDVNQGYYVIESLKAELPIGIDWRTTKCSRPSLESKEKEPYCLEIPTENGRYRVDDDAGSYLVDVIDGKVVHPGYIRPKGTWEPEWKLAQMHSTFVRVDKWAKGEKK